MAYDVFISYKESDGRDQAVELSSQFKSRGYSSIYFNESEIKEGDFLERLEEAIKACKVFILVLTDNAKKSILNKSCVWGNKDFDYVCWEIYKACENNKRVLILNTGCCFDPSQEAEEYKCEEMKNLMLNTGKSFSPLHTAQTFKMHQIFDENLSLLKKENIDVSSRMTLRKVIYGVLSLKYKSKNATGVYVDKECIFNKQALEALCEYITKDNSITTAIEKCTSEKQLTQYISESNEEIWQDFCEHFEIKEVKGKTKSINIKIKDPDMIMHYKMDCWEVLEYLYNSYCSMNFHHDYSSDRKKKLNRTISDYILALAWNRYFINNQDKKRELICTIIPELIKTHNHSQGYLYALIEKGRFENKEQWLFCDLNSEYSEQVKILFGEYYQDVFNTDMSRSNFTKTLFIWFKRNEYNFVNFCLQLIKYYKCSDAEIWNYLIKHCSMNLNRNSLEILKGCFAEYVDKKNINVILRMIEHGLVDVAYFNNDPQKDQKLFKLLCDVTKNKEYAKQYGQGLAFAFSVFWEKGQYTAEIKEIVTNLYQNAGIVAFRNLYNTIEGIMPEFVEMTAEKQEEELRAVPESTDEELLENKRFLYALDRIHVTDQSADIYNKALGRLLDICTFSNYYFGIQTLLFVKYRAKWITEENRQRLFERIADFVNNDGNTIKLADRHYEKLLEILEEKYFDNIGLNFKMAVFDDESVKPEIKMSAFNLWHDGKMKERLKERIKENTPDTTNDTQSAFLTIIAGKNQKWKNLQGWKGVYLYPLISELLEFETFVSLKSEIQKKLIHYIKTKQEYYEKFKALVNAMKENVDVWENLRSDVKTAFIMHIDKVVDNFEEIDFIKNYVEYIIEDLSSMRNRWTEVLQKYGIKEETLIFHMISLYKRKPWKTAKLCAVAQVKWYGQQKKENKWDEYNSKDMLFYRQRLFPNAVANPCIRELTVHLAKANYFNILQNIDKINIEKNVLSEHALLLEDITKGNFPLWFGVQIEKAYEAVDCRVQELTNVDFESVDNDFQKYEEYKPEDFEHEDEILNTAKLSRISSSENSPIDFEDASGKIILWKNSEEDENLHVLTRKKLFARYFQKNMVYRGLKFNCLLFVPQMCEEVKFAPENDIFDVNSEIEAVKKEIEEKFKDVLINDTGAKKWKFDRFVQKCGVDKAVKELINQFYKVYFNYLRMTQTDPNVAGAFSEYVKYIKEKVKIF